MEVPSAAGFAGQNERTVARAKREARARVQQEQGMAGTVLRTLSPPTPDHPPPARTSSRRRSYNNAGPCARCPPGATRRIARASAGGATLHRSSAPRSSARAPHRSAIQIASPHKPQQRRRCRERSCVVSSSRLLLLAPELLQALIASAIPA